MAYSSWLLQSFQEKFKTMAMHNLGWGFGIGSAGSQIEHINDGEILVTLHVFCLRPQKRQIGQFGCCNSKIKRFISAVKNQSDWSILLLTKLTGGGGGEKLLPKQMSSDSFCPQ